MQNIKNHIKNITICRKIYRWGRYNYTISKLYCRFIAKSLLGRYKKSNKPKYPSVIQLPITYKCNFDCVMCSMKTLKSRKGFTAEELERILQDKLFHKVCTVGVNGGEPFLLRNLDQYIETILNTLPKLKKIFIITNGYYTNNIITKMPIILDKCHEHNVKVTLSVSIDGYGRMQNIMRGHEQAFENSFSTCKEIASNPSKYCDYFGGICTITKVNIYHLPELEVWAKKYHIPMNYNVATIHKRICNEDKYEDFSVYTDERARLLTAEFFYTKFLETYDEQYFAKYYVVKYNKRIATCTHKFDVVTLTPNGAISYCATHSDEIGECLHNSAEKIYFSKDNLNYRSCMHDKYCTSCSHYSDSLDRESFLKLYIPEIKRLESVYSSERS